MRGNAPDNDKEDEDGGHEVGDVGQAHVAAVEGALQRQHFVFLGDEQVEKCDNAALILVIAGYGLVRVDGK